MRRWLPAALLAAILAALALRPPPGLDEPILQREFHALGTWISITLNVPERERRGAADTELARVERSFHAFERQWSVHGDGALARMNAALAAGDSIVVPEDMRGLFEQSATLSALSNGLFDPRIGRLVALWGFDDSSHHRDAPPEPVAIRELLGALDRSPGYRGPDYGPAPAVAWDFGAIAKGWLVDRSVESLKEAGFVDLIVNAGGNLRVAGRRGDRPWRIAIRHPRPADGLRILATLEPRDEAIISSGDYERYFEAQGQRYHHLLDPRSGAPARGLQSVTVIAPQAARADAASTALFVAGAEGWREMARELGLDTVLVVEASGRILATPDAAARLRLPDALSAEITP